LGYESFILFSSSDAVRKTFTCTDKYFEDAKEWFRQATQKYARMKKSAEQTVGDTT